MRRNSITTQFLSLSSLFSLNILFCESVSQSVCIFIWKMFSIYRPRSLLVVHFDVSDRTRTKRRNKRSLGHRPENNKIKRKPPRTHTHTHQQNTHTHISRRYVLGQSNIIINGSLQLLVQYSPREQTDIFFLCIIFSSTSPLLVHFIFTLIFGLFRSFVALYRGWQFCIVLWVQGLFTYRSVLFQTYSR